MKYWCRPCTCLPQSDLRIGVGHLCTLGREGALNIIIIIIIITSIIIITIIIIIIITSICLSVCLLAVIPYREFAVQLPLPTLSFVLLQALLCLLIFPLDCGSLQCSHCIIVPSLFRYRSINNEAPDYLSTLFERLSQNTIKELRDTKTDLKFPLLNGQKCFSYRGARLWNNLSDNVKKAQTPYQFKKIYKISRESFFSFNFIAFKFSFLVYYCI